MINRFLLRLRYAIERAALCRARSPVKVRLSTCARLYPNTYPRRRATALQYSPLSICRVGVHQLRDCIAREKREEGSGGKKRTTIYRAFEFQIVRRVRKVAKLSYRIISRTITALIGEFQRTRGSSSSSVRRQLLPPSVVLRFCFPQFDTACTARSFLSSRSQRNDARAPLIIRKSRISRDAYPR